VRTRPTPLVLYVAVAALAAPGALLAAEEPQQAQPGQPAQGETTTGEAPSAEKTPALPPPAERAPAEPPPAEAQAAPAPEPAPAAPAQEQPAQQPPAATASAPEPAKAKKEEKPAPVARAAAATVTIKDFDFAPKSVTVNVGETVTWTNSGPTAHSATASDGSFDTGVFKKGLSRSHTFQKAGTFSYICTPHPNMKGTVTVASTGSTPGGESGSGGSSGSGSDSDSAGTAADRDDGSSLPASGADAGLLALLGAGLLALGLLTRRRAGA
jgi:plastocyanin